MSHTGESRARDWTTVGGFDGEALADAGKTRVDGYVTTGMPGSDAERGLVLAGVAVSVSGGEGNFDAAWRKPTCPGSRSGASYGAGTRVEHGALPKAAARF